MIKKIEPLKITYIGLIGSMTLSVISCSTEDKPKKPNIVYILADDLGYNEIGCYGQKKIQTPNIDALADKGMIFTQHYSGSAVSAPSRCSLLTGFHMGHSYIRGNDEMKENGDVWNYEKASADPNLEGQRPLPLETQTLGKVLQRNGYKTGCFGKWGLGGPLTDGNPNKQGFDVFAGYNCQRQAHNYYPVHLWKNDKKIELENDLVAPNTGLEKNADPHDPSSYKIFTQKDYAPDYIIDEAIKFIDDNKNQAFFLYYPSPIPHVPLQAPKKYIEKYTKIFGKEKPYLKTRGYFPNQHPHATYAAMVTYLDDHVGRIVKKLKAEGLYENTLIIFSSDNGPSYAGGADCNFFESAKPFKSEYGWGKGFLHEGGIRVPMIACWEGKIEAGTKADHISAFWDVMPTLAELTGAAINTPVDGISFLPTLLGKNKQEKHEYLYWGFNGAQAVRYDKWKAFRPNAKQIPDEAIQLFNLNNDIQELNNVAKDNPEIVQKMIEILNEANVNQNEKSLKKWNLPDAIN